MLGCVKINHNCKPSSPATCPLVCPRAPGRTAAALEPQSQPEPQPRTAAGAGLPAVRAVWLLLEGPRGLAPLLSRRFPLAELMSRPAPPLPYDTPFAEQLSTALKEDAPPLGLLALGPLAVAHASRERLHVALALALNPSAAPLVWAAAPAAVLAAELADLLVPLLMQAPPADPLADAAAALALALPFGQPADTFAPRLRAALRPSEVPPVPDPLTRRPAWKLSLFRGKPRLEITIREELSAGLYDRATASDVTQLVGSLLVRADLEGVPQISLALSYQPAQFATPKTFVFDTAAALPGRVTTADALTTLTFVPPSGEWNMCSYVTWPLEAAQLPVRAFYQMKEVNPSEIKILLQLKLNQHLPNNFEYFDIVLPFAYRGQALGSLVDATPTTGTIHVEKDKRRVVWRIGQRFTGRNLEAAFSATIHFELASDFVAGEEEEVFCSGETCYARVHFKCQGGTFSGIDIDPGRVIIQPAVPSKPQIIVTRAAHTRSYLVWNSLGAVRHALEPVELSDHNT